MKRGWWILKCIVAAVLMVVLFGTATMFLWNWLVPELFSGPVITFAQAIGLLLLTKILFWSVGRGRHRNHTGGRHHWKKRWESMTPEDREKLKRSLKEKWCHPKTEQPQPPANV